MGEVCEAELCSAGSLGTSPASLAPAAGLSRAVLPTGHVGGSLSILHPRGLALGELQMCSLTAEVLGSSWSLTDG